MIRLIHGDVRAAGRFVKGERSSPATEFKKGQHWRPTKPHWDRGWLDQAYTADRRSAGDIAREAGVTPNAIEHWLSKHGIQRRTTSEARAVKHWGATGPANPMFGKRGAEAPSWKGGVTAERHAFNSSAEWRAAVRAVWSRDRGTCRRCSTKHARGTRFDVHHVVSFAVEELRAEPSNLALLCRGCHRWVHSKANVAREWIGRVAGHAPLLEEVLLA